MGAGEESGEQSARLDPQRRCESACRCARAHVIAGDDETSVGPIQGSERADEHVDVLAWRQLAEEEHDGSGPEIVVLAKLASRRRPWELVERDRVRRQSDLRRRDAEREQLPSFGTRDRDHRGRASDDASAERQIENPFGCQAPFESGRRAVRREDIRHAGADAGAARP